MRLIDADALKESFGERRLDHDFCIPYDEATARDIIDAAPTADPVKHERWVFEPKTAGYKCSGCGFSANRYQRLLWDYCPKCGASMWRGGDGEG